MRALAVLLVLGLTGCRTPAQEQHAPAADTTLESAHGDNAANEQLPMGLALKDDGRAVELAAQQVVLVSLKANHTTGYSWVLRDSVGPALLREVDPTYDVDSSSTGGVGAGGFETWRFRAAAAGRDTIVLEYRRPWEADRPAETTVRYFVTVR